MNKYLVKIAQSTKSVKNNAKDQEEDQVNPLGLGAMGLGIGALGGALIGRSKGLAKGMDRAKELRVRVAREASDSRHAAASLNTDLRGAKINPVLDPGVTKLYAQTKEDLVNKTHSLEKKLGKLTPDRLNKLVVEPNKRYGALVGGLIGAPVGAGLGLGTAYLYNSDKN